MAFKYKITAAEHAALADVVKAEYRAEGDAFILGIEGLDTADEMRRARDRERDAAAAEKARATKLEADLLAAQRANGDVAALDESWKKKLADTQAAHEATTAKLLGVVTRTTVNKTAEAIAKELAPTADALLLPHILPRLQLDTSGDEPLLRVLDAAGKPSAASLDDLRKELSTDPRFSAIIVATKASGGGAGGSHQGGGAAGKKLADMTEAERIEMSKTNPKQFQRLADEAKGLTL